MFPGGGHGRGGQYFGPAYHTYGGGGSRGGGWGRGRRQRRRGGRGAGWQGGRGGFPAGHLGQDYGQGYGQEDYGQEYYEEEYYGQEGYDGSQNGGQGDWQHAYESGGRGDSGALARSEVSDLREQLWGKEEEVESLRRALAEKNEAFQRKVEELESVRGTLAGTHEAKRGLEREKDQIIAQQSDEIRSVRAERDAARQSERNLRDEACESVNRLRSKLTLAEKAQKESKAELVSVQGELELAIQAEHDLRSETGRIIGDLERKEGEARSELQLVNGKVAGQSAQIEALQNMLRGHEDDMHRSSTQGAATVPGPEELLTEVREYTQAHDAIARWKEWFRFIEDDEFHDARTMADLGAILAEAQPRGRLYEFLTVGPLDEWLCLSRVCENKFTMNVNLCCRAPGGNGVACREVMVTVVDSVRRLRFWNQRW